MRPLALLVLPLALGCQKAAPKDAGTVPPAKRAGPPPVPDPRGPGFRATEITRSSQVGPYVLAGESTVAVFGSDTDGFSAQVLGPDGFGAPKKLDLPSRGAALAAVKPTQAGALLVTARKTERGHLVEAVVAGWDGAARGASKQLRESPEPILWVDAVQVRGGSVVAFATKGQRGAELRVVALDAAGAPTQPSEVAATGAAAWQLARVKDRAVLVHLAKSDVGHRVLVTPISEKGAPLAAETLRDAVMDPDVDAAPLRDELAIAWAEGGKLTMAIVGPDGKATVKPTQPLPSLRNQALVGLSSSGARVLVAWDEGRTDGPGKRVELATLGPDLGRVTGRAALSMGVRDDTAPVIEPTQEGFAFLTLAKACKKDGPCDDPPILPTLVRASIDLDAVTSEPVLVDLLNGEPPELAWGLVCKRECAVVAAGPAASYLVSMEGGEGKHRAAARSLSSASLPATRSLASLPTTARVAAAAVARVESGGLVAWVSEHHEGDPPPALPSDVDARAEAEKDRLHKSDPKKGSPRAAIVSVVPVDAKGGFRKAATLSVRAHSPGGVAIAPGDEGGAAVAWVALDEGDPQVFVTRVGPDGKRKAQAMLTRAKGDAGEVAIAKADDGHVVAWVDGRDGNGEVYAAKVDKNLQKRGPETRLTEAPGGASSVAVRVKGDEAWVAFSDGRGAADGAGDPFVVRYRLSDGKKIGDEARLAASPLHAHGLRFVELGDKVGVVWIDEAVGGKDAAGAKLQVAWLDAKGGPRATEAIDLPGGAPRGIALACDGTACRVAITRSEGDALGVVGARWTNTLAAPSLLATLAAKGEVAHEPMVFGDVVLASDERGDGGQIVTLLTHW